MVERRYWVYGPFEVPRINREVEKEKLNGFWDVVEDEDYGLATASGCYVFGVRNRGTTPWYIGQAKVAFRQECFTPHKLDHYNSVIGATQGTPFLFLVARATPTRSSFMKRLGKREADWVENMLIQQCLVVNPHLLNTSGTALAKEVVLPGVYRSSPGRYGPAVRQFRELLSLG